MISVHVPSREMRIPNRQDRAIPAIEMQNLVLEILESSELPESLNGGDSAVAFPDSGHFVLTAATRCRTWPGHTTRFEPITPESFPFQAWKHVQEAYAVVTDKDASGVASWITVSRI